MNIDLSSVRKIAITAGRSALLISEGGLSPNDLNARMRLKLSGKGMDPEDELWRAICDGACEAVREWKEDQLK